MATALHENCPNTEFFWSVFSCILTEYGDLRGKSPYSVRIQENTDHKKLRIWTLHAVMFTSVISKSIGINCLGIR